MQKIVLFFAAIATAQAFLLPSGGGGGCGCAPPPPPPPCGCGGPSLPPLQLPRFELPRLSLPSFGGGCGGPAPCGGAPAPVYAAPAAGYAAPPPPPAGYATAGRK
ncbi:hypothetical protein GCK72_018568 [Caenorhabditis remanei]|uniref:Uncharacterized protein n=2 Tax=Caenorhabditis TaxID=6237 RepID=E3LP99_CAERE|nr:hypothetical protein GCK72_018568 [Caenorhabditis remanei]EFP05800.1 hypothetical protein CRE_27249 [Caenorhabditis remanei]KAF1752014.1 hypothetical protein GCK72_018568 [Caenorhabditis remanei]